ncbi:MAG: pseudouridine synthase [Gemmatimonadota bacterium]
MTDGVRLQRLLARAGVASRRDCEELIVEGRVRVDGEVVDELGARVDPGAAEVEVDGRRVERQPARWVALHKPPGHLCTRHDPRGRPIVYDLLPDGPLRDLFHVGRLDYMSEGLLLLTNEGDVAHRLLHPSSGTEKRYEVRLSPPVPAGLARRLLDGVELDDGPASADAASVLPDPAGDGAVALLTLHEGRNREIRRMMDALDAEIRSLKRLSFGPVELGDLPPGRWRELADGEVEALREAG